MRVPDSILASAVFLCVKDGEKVIPAGTGFFLTVESETRVDTHSYLVTAKHCVEKARKYGKLHVRLNQFGGGASELIELPDRWEFHDDETNDVAVLPFAAPMIYEVMVFERESLATHKVIEEDKIGIGDDLMIVGLFSSRHGRTVNRPIVRVGNIAAMDDEPLEDPNSGLDFDAYLAEVRSIGGLSGSPVWVLLNPFRSGKGKWRVYLLGLVRGHWEKEEEWIADFGEGGEESLNTGIAMVTPIQKALDIIDSEEIVKDRKQEDRRRAKRSGQVLDSPLPDEDDSSEFDNFEDLTRKLVNTPKSEVDEKRRAEKDGS